MVILTNCQKNERKRDCNVQNKDCHENQYNLKAFKEKKNRKRKTDQTNQSLCDQSVNQNAIELFFD